VRKRRYQPTTTVIYGRQSLTKGASSSREDQVRICTRVAADHGLEVVDVILEPPSTGAWQNRGRDRPEWPRLLETIRLGKAQSVTAYETARLSRGGAPSWAELFEAAEAAGLDTDKLVLLAIAEQFVTEADLTARSAYDRDESKKRSMAITITKETNAAEGRFHGGRRAYGYAADGLTVVEGEAEEVRSLARRFLAGESLTSLARELNARGVPTASGAKWTGTGLRLVLTSPRVAGLRMYGWEAHDDGTPDKRRPVIVGDAAWPAILDRDTWTQTRSKVAGQANGKRGREPRFLLTGIARCWKCQNTLNGLNVNRPRRRRVRIYWCRKRTDGAGCSGVTVPAAALDDEVVAQVIAAAESDEFMDRLRANAGDREAVARAKANRELARASAHFDQVAADYGRGELSREAWMKIGPAAEARLLAAREAVEELAATVRVLPAELDRPEELRGDWETMTIGQRRTVISAMIEHVTVGAGFSDPDGRRGRRRPIEDRAEISWRI
jgi:DNA invertase Pin-like site-specific DNA recombinase